MLGRIPAAHRVKAFAIRALADLLARHPEALIKRRPEGPLE
jgi:hypothetical protein